MAKKHSKRNSGPDFIGRQREIPVINEHAIVFVRTPDSFNWALPPVWESTQHCCEWFKNMLHDGLVFFETKDANQGNHSDSRVCIKRTKKGSKHVTPYCPGCGAPMLIVDKDNNMRYDNHYEE
jgi:hypothetical protein